MRNYLSVIILTVVLFTIGCDRRENLIPTKVESNKILLKIQKYSFIGPSPVLIGLASRISCDPKERIIVIEGLINIAGCGNGNWIVPEIKIKNDNMIINIPDDEYIIDIGKSHFYLPRKWK